MKVLEVRKNGQPKTVQLNGLEQYASLIFNDRLNRGRSMDEAMEELRDKWWFPKLSVAFAEWLMR